MLTALLFIIVLGILVFVHELGHFLVAKNSGIRVDEFGMGFPPRLFGKKVGETVYSINLIPFGGFVKIFGENGDEELPDADKSRSFAHKNRGIQAAVLAAGVTANVLFAWLVISLGFMTGLPAPVGEYGNADILNPKVIVTSVQADSPAANAGLRPGDALLSLKVGDDITSSPLTPEEVSKFITAHANDVIIVSSRRGEENRESTLTPKAGILSDRPAIGIGMDLIGTVRFPIHIALWEGAKTTVNLLVAIAVGLFDFFRQLFTFTADLDQVTGPIGIANLVGDAAALGLTHLLMLTAFISLNLALINIVPFPALDGGRLLMVAIEAIRRKPIPAQFTLILNGIGFALLITLMILVTYKDILKLY